MPHEEHKDLIAKRRQMMDQNEEDLVNNLPRLWFRMYKEFKEEGFSEQHAFALLLHFVTVSYRG